MDRQIQWNEIVICNPLNQHYYCNVQCSNELLQCSNVLVLQCSNVLVLQCSNVQVLQSSKVLVH